MHDTILCPNCGQPMESISGPIAAFYSCPACGHEDYHALSDIGTTNAAEKSYSLATGGGGNT